MSITLKFDREEDGRFIATLFSGDEERVSCYGTDEYTAAAQALRVFFEGGATPIDLTAEEQLLVSTVCQEHGLTVRDLVLGGIDWHRCGRDAVVLQAMRTGSCGGPPTTFSVSKRPGDPG